LGQYAGVTVRRLWSVLMLVALAVLGAAATAAAWPWLGRHHVGARLSTAATEHGVVVGLIGLGILGLVVSTVGRWRTGASSSSPVRASRHPLRAMPGWVIPLGALAVGLITYVATVWLLDHAALPVGTDVERAKLRVETIRTGLSVGAGAAAALALVLAVRRQWLAERTQQANEYDAGERRVTEMYVKAADQLGSDKAPVRLAGLYALERLAQDNPIQRQIIVNVICAYLRMPYTLPPDPTPRLLGTRHYGIVSGRARRPDSARATVDPYEEMQVRLAAQDILINHLTLPADVSQPRAARLVDDPGKEFWPNIRLDLAFATLIEFALRRARVASASFFRATFVDDARFDRTTFTGDTFFSLATFNGDAKFDQAIFTGYARFDGATFAGVALFGGATFHGDANFSNVRAVGSPVNIWPSGWELKLDAQDATTGRLVRSDSTNPDRHGE
jgi:hypothetical protein